MCASRLNFPFLSGADLRYVLSHEHSWICAFTASVVDLVIKYLSLFFCPFMCFFHVHISTPDSDAGTFFVVFLLEQYPFQTLDAEKAQQGFKPLGPEF